MSAIQLSVPSSVVASGHITTRRNTSSGLPKANPIAAPNAAAGSSANSSAPPVFHASLIAATVFPSTSSAGSTPSPARPS